MATVTSVVTVDTNEWNYIDSTGVGHKVTNGQTFNLTIDDNGAGDVQYYLLDGQTPITTTDGYTLTFRPTIAPATNGTGNGNSAIGKVAVFTDAGQGSNFYGLRSEWPIQCSSNGVVQNWRVATMNPSDADYGSAGTIGFRLEDQFGNSTTVTGVTVAQAA